MSDISDQRRYYERMMDEIATEHRQQIDQLEAENAKLRELVDGLEYCAQGFVCDCCQLHDPSGTNHRRCENLEHELGMEVE